MVQTHANHPTLLNLPTELFGSVLNHLSNDKSSLKSCCLASRAFLPTAQAFLFRRVTLYADPLPKRPHLRAGTNLRHLVELSHLLSHTREFQIIGGGIDNESWLGIDPELLPALEAFIRLKNSHITADCSHSLQHISLIRINWHMSSPSLLNAAIQRLLDLESVTHIMIGWSDIPLNIFEHFPSRVKILELVHVTFQNSAPVTQVPDGHPKLPPIRPESLIIWNTNDNPAKAIFNNPSRECDGKNIRTLDLTVSGFRLELAMLVMLAPNVEKLTLAIFSMRTSQLTPLDFSQFSRLRCLYLCMDAISQIDINREIRWLVQSLRHLTETGNSFRSITFFYSPNEIDNIPAWAELDSVLAGSQFESESFKMTIEVRETNLFKPNLSITDFYSVLPRTIDKKLLEVVSRQSEAFME